MYSPACVLPRLYPLMSPLLSPLLYFPFSFISSILYSLASLLYFTFSPISSILYSLASLLYFPFSFISSTPVFPPVNHLHVFSLGHFFYLDFLFSFDSHFLNLFLTFFPMAFSQKNFPLVFLFIISLIFSILTLASSLSLLVLTTRSYSSIFNIPYSRLSHLPKFLLNQFFLFTRSLFLISIFILSLHVMLRILQPNPS